MIFYWKKYGNLISKLYDRQDDFNVFLSSTFLSNKAIHLHYLHVFLFFCFLFWGGGVSQLILTTKACSTYDKFLKPGKLLTSKLNLLIVRPLLFIELSTDVLFFCLRQRAHRGVTDDTLFSMANDPVLNFLEVRVCFAFVDFWFTTLFLLPHFMIRKRSWNLCI